MRAFFNWLVSQAILDTSPCDGIKAGEKERTRDRVLTPGELGRVLKAAQILPYPYGVIVQLLAHTGQRRQEVAGMRWRELDLEKLLWTLPDARTKNKRVHHVPLTPQVVELIKGCRSDGHFVASLSAERAFKV
jgi:integrase